MDNDSSLRTYKLLVAYEGTDYSGWQIQPCKRTIQGELQEALCEIAGEPISVMGSGRTDAGVHAMGQIASCRLRWPSSPGQLAMALNTKLPPDIVVRESVEVVDDFHPIRDALRKRYRYQLQIGGYASPFERRFRWRLKRRVVTEDMQMAAGMLVGEHDFASFQATGADRKSTVRTVFDCDVFTQFEDRESDLEMLAIEVEADGFLYNMVRNIVGSLVQIGYGKQDPTWLQEVLAARDRSIAGPTAPAHGLFLMQVDYSNEIYRFEK